MIYFVSGHRDITPEEFEKNYHINIMTKILQDKNCRFVVGDCDGADKMAIDYICNAYKQLGTTDVPLTIYHMFDKPRNIPSTDGISFRMKGGYMSDIERDSAMTEVSDVDIAFVGEGKRDSGTAQNILRRCKLL